MPFLDVAHERLYFGMRGKVSPVLLIQGMGVAGYRLGSAGRGVARQFSVPLVRPPLEIARTGDDSDSCRERTAQRMFNVLDPGTNSRRNGAGPVPAGFYSRIWPASE